MLSKAGTKSPHRNRPRGLQDQPPQRQNRPPGPGREQGPSELHRRFRACDADLARKDVR